MRERPRTPEFRRLGAVRPTELDLPTSKARALLLEDAWRRIAGDAIVQRTGSVVVRRGTLEVRCRDRSWKSALLALLPRLARALATECPELALSSWRLTVEGDRNAETAPILSLAPGTVERPAADDDHRPPRKPVEEIERPVVSGVERLRDLQDRYLALRKPPRS